MPHAAITRRPPMKPMPGRLGRHPGPAQIAAATDEELDEELDDVDTDEPTPATKKRPTKKA